MGPELSCSPPGIPRWKGSDSSVAAGRGVGGGLWLRSATCQEGWDSALVPWMTTSRKTYNTERFRWVISALVIELCQRSSRQQMRAWLSYRVISMTNLPKRQVKGPLKIAEMSSLLARGNLKMCKCTHMVHVPRDRQTYALVET